MKTALVFGSSGLVGSYLLKELIYNSNYSKIKIFIRSDVVIDDPKVDIIKTNFNKINQINEHLKGDDCFYCIGTTKKNSPDKNDYKRIELDLPKQIARMAKSNLVKTFFFISSGYANPKSSGDYLRFKGEVEEEIKSLNFSKIGIMRPSFLIGNRKENRLSEKIGIIVFKIITPILIGPLKKMRPINSEIVAKALVKVANESISQDIFESNEIADLVR